MQTHLFRSRRGVLRYSAVVPLVVAFVAIALGPAALAQEPDQPNLYWVAETRLHPDSLAEHREASLSLNTALEKHGFGRAIGRWNRVDTPLAYNVTIGLQSWDDIATMGQEWQAMLAKPDVGKAWKRMLATVESQTVRIYQVRRELSYQPGRESDEPATFMRTSYWSPRPEHQDKGAEIAKKYMAIDEKAGVTRGWVYLEQIAGPDHPRIAAPSAGPDEESFRAYDQVIQKKRGTEGPALAREAMGYMRDFYTREFNRDMELSYVP